MTPSEDQPAASGTARVFPPSGWGDRAIARATDAPLREGNILTLLRDGPATYEEWLTRIRDAQRWVHLENYIFRADEVGRRFSEALREKAAQGVPVRVLVDWFGCLDVPEHFWRRLEEAGVEVRQVNPPMFGAPLGVLMRDHRKVLAVDGFYASTGGVCIADGWLQRSPETGLSYRDTAVGVRGPAVADLERAFARMWDRAGEPLPAEERPAAHAIPKAGAEAVRVVVQEPAKMRVLRLMELVTLAVEKRLWIADPYFLSTPLLDRSLTAAARDGVDVRMLLPATNDHPVIGMLSRAGYRRLLEAGVRIHEYAGPMMHAKTTIADGRWSRVGSTNLNLSSLMANWELDVFVEDEGFGARMEEMFEQDFADAREFSLMRAGRRPTARPEGPVGTNERCRTRRDPPARRSRASATFFRVGGATFLKSVDPVYAHEQAIAAATSTAVLAASLLGARFPRLVAWPMAAAGILLGGSGLLRTARRIGRAAGKRESTES